MIYWLAEIVEDDGSAYLTVVTEDEKGEIEFIGDDCPVHKDNLTKTRLIKQLDLDLLMEKE